MVHDGGDDGVLPELVDGAGHVLVKVVAGVCADVVVEDALCAGAVVGVGAVHAELAHGEDDVVRALEEVAEDGGAVGHELGLGVAVLVDDLHLLDDRALARLARAWYTYTHTGIAGEVGVEWCRLEEMGRDAPSRRILHSFLNLRESSSICLSISCERWRASLS